MAGQIFPRSQVSVCRGRLSGASLINVIAGKDELGHISQMFSTKRHNRQCCGISVSRVLQTWLMAFVILLAGITQSGLIPALITGHATGISQANAADAVPGGNVVLICTPNGIEPVNLADKDGDQHTRPDNPPPMAGHAFCSLCATHHGAVVAIELPDMVPVPVVHHLRFAVANGKADGREVLRVHHSRAPPVAI